jgi:hypothetical protein
MNRCIEAIVWSLCLAFTLARAEPHQWTVTLKAFDDERKPVGGASVSVNYLTNQMSGLTDTNGLFIASHTDESVQLAFRVEKPGYYPFASEYQLGFDYERSKWNPTVDIPLKRVLHPIPMYAKLILRGPPTNNAPVAYDLERGDWVAPYGSGQATDIIFTRNTTKKSKRDYEDKLIVSFPLPGDGIQEFRVPYSLTKGSALRSPHHAPAAGYIPRVLQETIQHPDQRPKFDWDPERNYFFRVRTTLDEKGNVKSALYGKIYGDFMQFTYYLNPTPNDRNVEFDPKQNLLKGLQSFEQVTAP